MSPSELELAVPAAGPTTRVIWRALAPAASVLACSFLLALGAYVRVWVPGTDVPMTLQVLAVLLTGFALTPRRAVAATLLYLVCGAAGLPVFASSAGLAGSTAGYLVGFVVGAWLVSALKGKRDAGSARLLLAGAVGVAAIFALGIAWRLLARLIGLAGGDLWLAVTTGLVPFVGKAVVELLLAVTLVGSIRRLRIRRVSRLGT